jgi:hypothetical protein
MTEASKTPHVIPVTIGKDSDLILGSGATARSRNIHTIKRFLEKGHSENEILDSLEIYFKPATILEYIRIARKFNQTSDMLTDAEEINELRKKKEKAEKP